MTNQTDSAPNSALNVVLGVDTQHASKAASMLRNLRLPLAEVFLLNVIESALPDGSFPPIQGNHPLGELMRAREAEGTAALAKIANELASGNVKTEQRHGSPARELIESARQHRADLIAVGSSQPGKWGSLFFGSVTKALSAEATQSILVGKDSIAPDRPLRVVLATDHSQYSSQCMDRFLTWNPTGISKALVVTAAGSQDLPTDSMKDMQAMSRSLCTRIESQRIDCDILIRPDNPQDLISHAMKDFGADLLVLGARGHGFWNRLWFGSVAHYHVVATPYNVLVMRA